MKRGVREVVFLYFIYKPRGFRIFEKVKNKGSNTVTHLMRVGSKNYSSEGTGGLCSKYFYSIKRENGKHANGSV